MAITDVIVGVSCLVFLYMGWLKGFMRTILGPVSLIAGTVISYIYYAVTKNLIVSLLIGIVGPFFLKIVLSLVLKIWNKTVSNRTPASALSRAFGSLFNLIWSGGLLILSLILLIMIPDNFFNLAKIREDIHKSVTFSLIGRFMNDHTRGLQNINETLAVFNNEKQMEKLKSSLELTALMEDQHVQSVLHDEETLKQIQQKDLGHLMVNPKMLSLLEDQALMKKMLALHAKMLAEGYVVGAKTQSPPEGKEK